MMKFTPKTISYFLALAGMVLTSGLAQAASVKFTDINADGSVTIAWEGFITFCVSGQCSASGSTQVSPQALSFNGRWYANSNGGPGGTKVLDFVDPGTTHIRDRLTVTSQYTANGGSLPGGGTCNTGATYACGTITAGSFSSESATNFVTSIREGEATIDVTSASQDVTVATAVPANLSVFVQPGFADLTITKSHANSFIAGQNGNYTILVKNSGPRPTYGGVIVAETPPTGTTLVGFSGTGWGCEGSTCYSQFNALAAGSTASLLVTVNVASPSQVVNSAKVSGGGDVNPDNTQANTANDPTTILPAVDLTTSIGTPGTSTSPVAATTTAVNTTTTQGVNTASGNTYITFSDLIVPGKGLRFAFIRSYNDQDPYIGPLLRGWTHSYNILLTVDSGVVTVKEADGHQNVFTPAGTGFNAPNGVYDILAQSGSTYTLTRPNQTVLSFGLIPNTTIIRLLSITDKNGNTQNLTYSAVGNLLSFTDVGGGIFNFGYDASNHLISLQDVALSRTYQYGNDGTNLTSYTDSAGSVSHYSYSPNNLLAQVTDPRSNSAVNNVFDSQGRTTQTSHSVGSMTCITNYVYNDVSHVTTITDPLGNVTKHYYDTSKRLIKIENALGFTTQFAYTDPNNKNSVTAITNPLGKTTSYTYVRGNRSSVTDPLGHQTLFEYDLKNNITKETDANQNATKFAYDPKGNLITITDAAGGTTQFGGTTPFEYDANGNKLTFTNANGKVTSYTYDGGNRVLTTTDPVGNTTTSTYDAGGRLSTQTEPAGNSKTLTYDALGRLTKITHGVGTSLLVSAGTVIYAYDANGNRITMADSGSTAYTYDAVNRLTSVTFPGGRVVGYTYDCNGNRTSMTYAGKTVKYAYDAINRLVTVADGSNVTKYTYDKANNLLTIAYPNGASVGYTYDAANRLTQVRNSYKGNPDISSFTYALDNVGNRTRVTDGAGTTTVFTYDPLYRMTKSTIGKKPTLYTYDAVGNRLMQTASGPSTGYTYDAADKLLSAGPATFSYDANGNQVSQTAGSTIIKYVFDTADRLVSVTAGTKPASSFTYDGDGNRVTQKVGAATYTYLNDITNDFTTVLDENGPDGHIQYVRGKGLVSANGPGFTYYYHFDAQTTVAGLTDDKGHLDKSYVRDVWGNLLSTNPPPQVGTDNKFGYTGEALDPGTGLYYLRTRYYDPTLGRFISKDPFPGFDRSPQTLNRFSYVRNNPATLTDRTGLCTLDVDIDLELDPDLFPCPTPGPP
jgi:RHS repeat-associated protein